MRTKISDAQVFHNKSYLLQVRKLRCCYNQTVYIKNAIEIQLETNYVHVEQYADKIMF